MPLVGRVWNLLRGLAARWVGRREQRHPDAVYVSAIEERVTQYAKLREAAAGIIYLRSKLAKELERESAELGRAGRQLEIAVGRRDGLGAEVTRLTAELTELTKEAEGAKQNLVTFQREIARLREERVRMLARLASAKARLRFQTTLNGLSPDADIRALEEVRDHINRLVAETQVSRDLGDTELEKRLGRIREAEAESAARAQLDELKRSRRASWTSSRPSARKPRSTTGACRRRSPTCSPRTAPTRPGPPRRDGRGSRARSACGRRPCARSTGCTGCSAPSSARSSRSSSGRVRWYSERMGIRITRVTKRFDKFLGLDNVSLEVPSGALLALLGPSGSGKTTRHRIGARLVSREHSTG